MGDGKVWFDGRRVTHEEYERLEGRRKRERRESYTKKACSSPGGYWYYGHLPGKPSGSGL